MGTHRRKLSVVQGHTMYVQLYACYIKRVQNAHPGQCLCLCLHQWLHLCLCARACAQEDASCQLLFASFGTEGSLQFKGACAWGCACVGAPNKMPPPTDVWPNHLQNGRVLTAQGLLESMLDPRSGDHLTPRRGWLVLLEGLLRGGWVHTAEHELKRGKDQVSAPLRTLCRSRFQLS